ncbi:hypothetical protein L5G32_11875 [Gordonia sp. HY002]|uniref:hypothetical protein n=1 Tax=Gordonia zhenghanii TaxID=2911516 RepID=UPI001EF1449A|nr:hypothetical protein [Gordonia zhenghanii]MCF8570965.1 hypothetical protein [Gordonia zhenghanii]MCF8604708.1 hypothetical protein [Gordonia zhenghanii]
MVRTGTPGLDVAGLAVTAAAGGHWAVPTHAALASLHDARFPPTAVTAVFHMGHDIIGPMSGAVRDVIGATRCTRTFDVDVGAMGLVAALAVGASLVDDGAVLITVCEPGGGAASIVLAGGSSSRAATFEFDQARGDETGPYVLRSASPVRGLLDCRAAGRYDVVLVAADGASPTASVRCRLQSRH